MRWKEIKDKIKVPCFPGMHLEKEQELMALANFIQHLHHNKSLFGGQHQDSALLFLRKCNILIE
jgi:hypothetical protein